MAKVKKVRATNFSPFDAPAPDTEIENTLLRGEDTVHIGAPIFTTLVRGELVWFVKKDFDDFVKLVVERGAVRGQDYIITLHKDVQRVFPIMTLHTTHSFLSRDET